jgi:hypothetical protein
MPSYDGGVLGERVYTAEEVDAAVAAITDPERLKHAQEIVVHIAPALQKILGEALAEGGYFEGAHNAETRRVAEIEDPQERLTAVATLAAEESRVAMFVGVAVGFELARELMTTAEED